VDTFEVRNPTLSYGGTVVGQSVKITGLFSLK